MPMPANIFLALLAAGFWGMGDFSGGMSVKSAPAGANPLGTALRVVLFSHLTSFTVLVGVSLGLGLVSPGGASLAWGLGAGVCAGVSLSAFYMALSRGAMGASAAISGVLAAAIPAGVTLAVDGSPGWYRLAGFAVAGLASWLIAAGPAERESLGTILLATGAGIGFGLYFVALKYAGEHAAPVWTMATARVGSICTCALILAGLRVGGRSTGPVPVSRRMVLWILSTAVFDTSGNLLFIAATRAGRLDIASVLASLYPASTILLAAGVLKERPTGRQMMGMVIAAVAVGMITV